ncbi:MAG TPA: hypothetical protein VGF66_05355 [Gaiellaceae bacterium]
MHPTVAELGGDAAAHVLPRPGFAPDDEEATLTGMSIDREPPAAPHIDVRRTETLDPPTRTNSRSASAARSCARWQYAVVRGTRRLVVQAGHMSAPVLDRLGFEPHGVLHLYADPRVASGYGDDRDQHRAG